MAAAVEAEAASTAAVRSAAAVVDMVAAAVVAAEEAITNPNFDCKEENRRANRRFSSLCTFCA
jgi:hypothetical protein